MSRHDALDVFGKAITSLIESAPDINATSLSNPIAIPACGGAPYLSASSRNPNLLPASSLEIPRRLKILSCMDISWIRTLPPPISTPFNKDLDPPCVPLNDRFNGPVGKVPDPAGETQLQSFPSAVGPEKNTLDLSVEDQMCPVHGLTYMALPNNSFTHVFPMHFIE